MLCCTSILANSSPNTTPPSQVFPSNGKLTGNTDSVSNKSQVNSSNRRSGKLLLLSFLWNCSAMPFIIISNIVIIRSCNFHDQPFDHQMIMTFLYRYNYRYMHIYICVSKNHTNRTSYIIKNISISWLLSCLLHLKGHPFSITAGYSVRTKIGLSAPRKPRVFQAMSGELSQGKPRLDHVRHEKMGGSNGNMLEYVGWWRIQW